MYPSYEMYSSMIGVNAQIPQQPSNPTAMPKKDKLRPNALAIINPNTNRNVVLDFINETSTPVSSTNSASVSSTSSVGSVNNDSASSVSAGTEQQVSTTATSATTNQLEGSPDINLPDTSSQQQSLANKAKERPQQGPPQGHYVHETIEYNANKQQNQQQMHHVNTMRDNLSQGREPTTIIHQAPPPLSHPVHVSQNNIHYQQSSSQVPYHQQQHNTDMSQQTPVVSAISDGPSVDITPKHGSKKKP